MKIRLLLIFSFMFSVAAFGQVDSLPRQLVAAQIANQQAQASYYNSQQNAKSPDNTISLPAVATTIAALLALTGVLINSILQLRLENRKWKRSNEDTLKKEVREAAEVLTKNMVQAIQLMQYTTWEPRHYSTANELELNEYNEKMKKLWPDLAVSRAVLAALNNGLYMQVNPYLARLGVIDNQIAFAINHYLLNPEDSIKKLKTASENASDLGESFLNSMSESLSEVLISNRAKIK